MAGRRGASLAELIRQGEDMLLEGLPPEQDPLLDVLGLYDSGLEDLAQKHNEYLVNLSRMKAVVSREVFVDTGAWIAA